MAGEDQLFQRFGREFRKGHVLFREGEPGREMFVVQSGKVNITKTVRETEKILATLGPGEFFGEMAILNNKPRSAGATMAEDGKLLVIDPRMFEAMIRGNVEIAVRLIKKLSDRLQEADDQIENLLLNLLQIERLGLGQSRVARAGRADPCLSFFVLHGQGLQFASYCRRLLGGVGLTQQANFIFRAGAKPLLQELLTL